MDTASDRTRNLTVLVMTAAVVIAVAALVVASWAHGSTDPDPPSVVKPAETPSATPDATPSVTPAPASDEAEALAVLRDWDAARAAAWADGDSAALRELYVAGSAAGERDVAMLRRWSDRGLRIRDLRMQVLSLRVWASDDRRLVVVVTDRLAGGVAVRASDAREWPLPRDRANTRRLVFRRTAGTWRLAASYDRPLDTSAVTSGSANS